jgi:HPt (histidine-containing phosphotransfer) domain-containing protein
MIIDQKILVELYGDLETAKPLIKLFIRNADQLVKEVEQAIFLERQDKIESVCHRLLGQSRYIASPALASLSEDICAEDNAKRLTKLRQLKSIISEIKADEQFK